MFLRYLKTREKTYRNLHLTVFKNKYFHTVKGAISFNIMVSLWSIYGIREIKKKSYYGVIIDWVYSFLPKLA